MFDEIVDIVGASSNLFELPLSFFQKTIAVEEGFTSAPVLRLSAESLGRCRLPAATEALKLIARRNYLHYQVRF
jgi:hypothetical protein